MAVTWCVRVRPRGHRPPNGGALGTSNPDCSCEWSGGLWPACSLWLSSGSGDFVLVGVRGEPISGSGTVSGQREAGLGGRQGARRRRDRRCLGDELDVAVRGEDLAGGGPAVEDPHDVSAGVTHDAGWGVPELPAHCFGFGVDEPAGQT